MEEEARCLEVEEVEVSLLEVLVEMKEGGMVGEEGTEAFLVRRIRSSPGLHSRTRASPVPVKDETSVWSSRVRSPNEAPWIEESENVGELWPKESESKNESGNDVDPTTFERAREDDLGMERVIEFEAVPCRLDGWSGASNSTNDDGVPSTSSSFAHSSCAPSLPLRFLPPRSSSSSHDASLTPRHRPGATSRTSFPSKTCALEARLAPRPPSPTSTRTWLLLGLLDRRPSSLNWS